VLRLTIVCLGAALAVKSAGLVQGLAAAPPQVSPPQAAPPPQAQAAPAAPTLSEPAVAAPLVGARDTPQPPPPKPLAPLADAAPPATDPTVEAPSTGERQLLSDLRQRRVALDAQQAALDQREALLAAAGKRIDTRVAELEALQTKLEALEAERRAHEEENWQGLVKLYASMKPRDAAAIFNDLDMAVLLPLVDRMQERKAAPILAAMLPDRARLVTQKLAELRSKQTNPAASGGT
jgi:flagellar motility protein MotE (MotC chaperone)